MRTWLMVIGLGLAAAAAWRTRREATTLPVKEVSPKLESKFEGGRFGASPVPDPADMPRYFAKVPDMALREITRRIDTGERVQRETREIAYTATTVTLLTAIIGRIDRKRNRAEISYPELMTLAGIKSRTTLADHLYLLETQLGYIGIRRGKGKGVRRAINVFSLHGVVAQVVLPLDVGGLEKPSERTGIVQSVDGKPESKESCHVDDVFEKTPPPGEGIDKEPIPEICLKIGMDDAVTRDLMRDYGRERVIEVATWASKQKWAKNPAALAVARIRDTGFVVPLPPVPRTPLSDFVPDEEWDTEEAPAAPDFDPVWMPEPEAEEVIDPVLASTYFGNLSALDVWEVAHGQLELQFDRSSFDTWMKHIKVVGYDDGVLILGTRNEHQCEMCQHRLYKNIRRVVRDVSGMGEMELEFKVVEFQQKKDDDMPLSRRLAMRG